MHEISILDINLKITNSKLQLHLPGADELKGLKTIEGWKFSSMEFVHHDIKGSDHDLKKIMVFKYI